MGNFIKIFLLLLIFSVFIPITIFGQTKDSSQITLKQLKGYLLKTSKTADRLLPLFLKEEIISKLEYDSLVLNNKELKLLLKINGKEDSSYLQPPSYKYAIIDEFIFHVSHRKKEQSKKTSLYVQKHLKAIRNAERAITLFNGGIESTKEINKRFGFWKNRVLEPI